MASILLLEEGTAILIPPLKTIQIQLANLCQSSSIPFLNLDELDSSSDIAKKLMEVKPRVIISSIEDISKADIQAELQSVDIRYVAIDECHVMLHLSFLNWYIIMAFCYLLFWHF